MPDAPLRSNLLAELESLQDHVLEELEALNERIEKTLLEFGSNSPATAASLIRTSTLPDRRAA